jgi:hypothetical protein
MIEFTAKIDVTKILKEHLFQSQKTPAKYLDIAFHIKETEYGDGYITQSVSKEARDKGERGPIVGNWKRFQKKQEAPKPAPKKEQPPLKMDSPSDDSESVPF